MAVKTLKEMFAEVLREWSSQQGAEGHPAVLNEDGEVSLELGKFVATLMYRDESDSVVLWFECGAPEDSGVFKSMLRAQDRFSVSRGFTYAYDLRTGRVLVHDRRGVERLATAEALQKWLETGCSVVSDLLPVMCVGKFKSTREV